MIEMPFNLLVTTCVCTKQHLRYEPDGSNSPKLTIDALDSEKVIFFEIDDKSNPLSHFRDHFDMNRNGEPICDILVFYFSETKKANFKKKPKILCLVELKSLNIQDAVVQIENTYKKIRDKFTDTPKKYNPPIKWCGYILSKKLGSAPTLRLIENRKKLETIFGKKCSAISKDQDIGPFLRTCDSAK